MQLIDCYCIVEENWRKISMKKSLIWCILYQLYVRVTVCIHRRGCGGWGGAYNIFVHLKWALSASLETEGGRVTWKERLLYLYERTLLFKAIVSWGWRTLCGLQANTRHRRSIIFFATITQRFPTWLHMTELVKAGKDNELMHEGSAHLTLFFLCSHSCNLINK